MLIVEYNVYTAQTTYPLLGKNFHASKQDQVYPYHWRHRLVQSYTAVYK